MFQYVMNYIFLYLECIPDYYLSNNACQKCGHCNESKQCNNITGECVNGCEENWATTTCDSNNLKYPFHLIR